MPHRQSSGGPNLRVEPIPKAGALLSFVKSGLVYPTKTVTQHEPLSDMLEAYRQFDRRSPGWLQVALNATH
jgi:threonine dehydrogenase-like Zn-dependent dehydrogenase